MTDKELKQSLGKIFIRSEGRTVNLAQLVESGKINEIQSWFLDKVLDNIDARGISLEDANKMIEFLESLGITIVRLK